MDRLTHERVNGIKSGYWSSAKKEDLVQRLAAYENTGLEPEEIVRCKNCKYRDADDLCTGRGHPYQFVPADGFCDKGRRKDENQNDRNIH